MELNKTQYAAVNQWLAFVDPNHPTVKFLLEDIFLKDEESKLQLVLSQIRTFQWTGTQGWESFEQVWQTKKGNCIALSALLCSMLTRVGICDSYVLVAGGGLLNSALIAVSSAKGILTAHAWTVIFKENEHPHIVDPVTMKQEAIGDEASFSGRLRLAAPVDQIWSVLFNNQNFHIFANSSSCFWKIQQLSQSLCTRTK
jgi:hypothetical protein